MNNDDMKNHGMKNLDDLSEGDMYVEHEATPELDELQQYEPEASVLDVDVRGPVQTHPLPARVAVAHNVIIDTSTTQIFGWDLRRARALVWAHASAASFYHLGTRSDEVEAGAAARPLAVVDTGGVPPMILEFRHCEPVYAKADTGTVIISYLLEQWAD